MRRRKVVVFWTDENTRSWITSELVVGRLRQGWGGPGMQLVESGGVVPLAVWAERFAESAGTLWGWNPDNAQIRTRHSILSRMLTLSEGDLAVVPEMPSTDEFTIACVAKGYRWDDQHFRPAKLGEPRSGDFGHVMQIDPNLLVTPGYGSSPETQAISAKFRVYRSAVNHVRDEQYAEVVCRLFEKGN